MVESPYFCPLGDRRVEAHPRIPASRRPAILTRSASFEVARIGFRPERGSHSPAQGTALGTGVPKDPCPEGAPHGVRSPACVAGPMIEIGSFLCCALTGLCRGDRTGFPGRCPGLSCGGPFGAREGKR